MQRPDFESDELRVSLLEPRVQSYEPATEQVIPQAQNDVTAGDRGRTRTRSEFEDEIMIVTVGGALVLGNVRPSYQPQRSLATHTVCR